MEPIYSVKNPRIKEWAALKQKKYREQTGQFMIEGVRLVEEAITSDVDIVHILYSLDRPNERLDQLIEIAGTKGYPMVECTEQVLAHVADTQTPQGIVAIAKKADSGIGHTIDLASYSENSLFILIDGIQDPGNLGTIIRTADAVGADGIIVSEHTVDPYHPKVIRATMGSLFHIPVVERSLPEIAAGLKEQGVAIVGSSSHKGEDYYHVDLKAAQALVVGSEANGISEALEPYVDTWLRLPMLGRAESLNAAIAASVMMYEVIRQRHS